MGSKPKWQKTNVPKRIKIILWGIMKDNPTQNAREQAIARLKFGKEDDKWIRTSRDTFRALKAELIEMPESELETLPLDIREWTKGIRENQPPVSANNQNSAINKHILVPQRSENVIKSKSGLLPEKTWQLFLLGYKTQFLNWLRVELSANRDQLVEKFNKGLMYFGYSLKGSSDCIYLYIQKKKFVIDVKLDPKLAANLRNQGFNVSLRQNFQAQAGWLTGWDIPVDIDLAKRQVVLDYLLKALS